MIATAVQPDHRKRTGTGITAGYIRLTREESILTGLSVPAQRDGINSYVHQHELPHPQEYLEERPIGADVPFEKRLAGRRLIADVRAGKISNIVCRDIDRLSRDTVLWVEFVRLCCESGVTIHTFSGPLALKSPSDRFASTVRAAAAQLEKDQVADRVKRAKRELAKQGKHLGGPPPFGYTSRSRRQAELAAAGASADEARAQAEREFPLGLVIEPKEAAVVQMVFDLYVNSLWGCRRIANELNRLGHRRRSGRLWHPDKVRRIINDPALTGMIAYDEQRFESGYGKRASKFRQTLHPGKHEPIVTMSLWKKAQMIKGANTPVIEMPVTGRKSALAGVLRCRCGATMTARGAGKDKSYFYYVCTKRKYYGPESLGGCNAERVNSDRLHAAFWGKLAEIVRSDDTVDRVYQAARKQMGRKGNDRQAKKQAAELAKVEQDLDLWYGRHDEAGGDAEKEAAWRRIVQLTERQKTLKQQVQEVEQKPLPERPVRLTREQVKAHLAGIASLVKDADDHGQALIRSLVEHQGLEVQMLDSRTVKVAMSLTPPGAAGEPVTIETVAAIPSENKIDLWVTEQNAQNVKCACGCGRRMVVTRFHYWRGVPKLHSACRHKGMAGKRAAVTGNDYINGTELAKKLGIGRSTLNRWVRAGKLPKPERGISGMLMFGRGDTAAALR